MEAPRIPSFFKTRTARQFEHKPIYYDQRKEEMEERRQRIASELGVEKDSGTNREERLRDTMRERWQRSNQHQKRIGSSGYRVLLIAGVLCLIVYYLFR